MKNYLSLLVICLISGFVYLGFEYFYTDGKMGVPLDDTWIHFQFADNFAHGHFFEYNAGEPAAGTTSPLYVIVLGAAALICNNFIFNSLFISFIFFLLSVLTVYKISLLLFTGSESSFIKKFTEHYGVRFLAMIPAFITIISGRLVWSALSGMETTMFTFFCLSGLFYYVKDMKENKITLVPTILFSFAVVSRPEGFLIYAIYLFDAVYNFKGQRSGRNLYVKLICSILIFSAISLPYLLFSYNLTGHFFPNTFRGQGGTFRYLPDFNYIRIVMVLFSRDNLLTAVIYLISFFFYILNLKKFRSQYRLLNLMMLWIFLLPLVSSVLIPNWRHHVRYMIPLIPFINIAAVYFIFIFLESGKLKHLGKYLFRKNLLISVLLICSFVYYIVYAVALGKNTGNINDQQVKLAKWVNKNVGRNETIGLNDIGAITFINKNRIIDMAGLVTPEILRYQSYNIDDKLDSMNYLLKKNNVSYIIIYDHWFTEYLRKYGNELTVITSATLEDNTICGGDEMKVYKTNFSK